MWKLVLILIPLLLYLFLGMYYGVQTTLYAFSGLFFLLPTLTLVKSDFYERYWSLVNPWMQKSLEQKDETFRRKNKWMNIISWYILSFLFFLQGSFASTEAKLFENLAPGSLVPMVLGIVFLVLAAGVANHLIIKKSRTNGDVIFWSILAGVVLFGMITILVSRLLVRAY